jgi:hypothetical protein
MMRGGTNFGLNDTLRYYEFELDSLDASGSKAAGVAATDWPVFLLGGKQPLTNIAAIKILEVQIPFSWYVFVPENTQPNANGTQWTLNETGGVSNVYPIIVTGNYQGGPALATALQSALNAVSSLYVVTYNASTQKMTFTTTKAGVTAFSFSFGAPTNSGNTNPRLYMGFPGGTTVSTGLTMISPNIPLLSGPSYLYVNSSSLGPLTNLYLPQGAFNLGGGNAGPQIAKVPVAGNSGDVLFWQDPDPQKWFDLENLSLLNQVDFYLTLGNTTTQLPLKLNGLSFSLKLAILTNEFTHSDLSSGLAQSDRVVKRMRSY